MPQERPLSNSPMHQKERWKKLTLSFADPELAVAMFNVNGVDKMLRKDLSFLMAFAVLVRRMGADEIAERATSWINLKEQSNAPDSIKIVCGYARAFLIRFGGPACVGYHVTRVNVEATIYAVYDAGKGNSNDFMRTFEPLLGYYKPSETIIYMYNHWILSNIAEKGSVARKNNLFINIPREIKHWAHSLECIRGNEEHVQRVCELAHDDIPKDDEFLNRLTAGLCAYGYSALFRVVDTRERLMRQDGVDWDASEENIPHLKAERRKLEMISIFARLETEFRNLLASCQQDIYLTRTTHLDAAKTWAKKDLDSLTDAEWEHIWSLVGINETSTTMQRGQFIIGTFMAEKYSMLTRDPKYGENGFPLEAVTLTERLAYILERFMEEPDRIVE